MAKNSHSNRIFLIFHGRFPSEKAAALFAAKSAAAFASLGREVILLVPRRLGRFKESCFDFYCLPKNFKVVFLPTIDLFNVPGLKALAFLVSFISFSKSVFYYLLWRAKKTDIIYSNESLPLLLASFMFSKTVYEIHDFPKNNFYYRTVFRRVKMFVATNLWKKEKIRELFGISSDRIVAEMNAVSLEDFSLNLSKVEARRKLNLPKDGNLICYSGMLRTMGMEKGIGILLEALKSVNDCKLLIVGGNPEDVEFYEKIAGEYGIIEKVVFTGFVPHKMVPLYLSASDVLVTPFPKTPHYEFYMSPMKIFEYMAANRPIVATDLNSIKEILTPDAAVFVEPDSVAALAAGVQELLADREKFSRYASKALSIVSEHTWQKRASRIIDFLG